MSITVRLHSDHFATVRVTPSRWRRFFGSEDRDFEAWRITDLTGSHTWITHDNRPVAPAVADAIEAELTRACVGDRHNKFRT